MTLDSRKVRSERHVEIGELIQRDVGILLDRWSSRVVTEQTSAARARHDVLMDELGSFLVAMGGSLAASMDVETLKHCIPALEHGEQRWENGWSLTEIVHEFQMLRLIVLEYLDETIARPLRCHEVIAVGLALDEAIAASVTTYVSHRDRAVAKLERDRAAAENQREQELLEQKAAALQEESRRKDEFLATLGHELRNPLTPIRNAVYVLQSQPPDAPTLEWIGNVVERQVRHMTRLIDDLLDVSRISAGKVQLRRETLDLAALLRTAVNDHRSAVEQAGLQLKLQSPECAVYVAGDAVRLTQVFGNLLQNATKFTDPGGKVDATLFVDEDMRQVIVRIRDTGIGMDAKVLQHVFETFSQVEQSRTRSPSGLGLGLAVVKGLVELHGGTVSASSDGAGCGVEMTVRLALADPPEGDAAARPPPRKNFRSLRVLIIDDNADSAESEKLLLELYGHQVAVAYTGEQGVSQAREFRPDVVLCDIGLPLMDGYTVAQTLRQDPATADARLIAVTGYGSAVDRRRCAEAGFERLLAKPVEPSTLESVLADISCPEG